MSAKRIPHCSAGCGRRVWHFDSQLCAPCDPRSSVKQQAATGRPRRHAPHGTLRRYRRGCTCAKCRSANADDKREWRQQA